MLWGKEEARHTPDISPMSPPPSLLPLSTFRLGEEMRMFLSSLIFSCRHSIFYGFFFN